MNATPATSADQLALRDIESTLRQLWHESTGDDHPATQVRTLNLAVFVPADQHTPALERTINELAIQYPGRTITMVAHPEPQGAYAQASLACRIGESDKHLCGEQITLRSGDGGTPLVSTTAALLLPGLPVFVWWVGDPPIDTPLFDTLTELADRVLVDAHTWQHHHATLRTLANVVAHTPRIACTDVLWTTLTPWRQAVAQCFDLPASQPHLFRLEHITIMHGRNGQDHLAAQLLVGWLGSRLGWQVEGNGTLRRADNQQIGLTLREQDGAGTQAVQLRSADASFAVVLRVNTACGDVTIALPNTAPAQWVAPLKEQSLATYVGEELMLLGHDAGYEAALQFAAQLSGQ